MQKANLSYYTLLDCIKQLHDLGLVKLEPATQEYATTKKGVTFLAKWIQLQHYLLPNEKVSINSKRILPSGKIIKV
jgi:predicted transcriptional regulator